MMIEPFQSSGFTGDYPLIIYISLKVFIKSLNKPTTDALSITYWVSKKLLCVLVCDGTIFGTTDQWLVGQILDAKSNVCPTPVQSPSNVRPKKGRVEGLSKHCPGTVRALSNLCQVPKHLDRDWTGKSRDCREPVHRS